LRSEASSRVAHCNALLAVDVVHALARANLTVVDAHGEWEGRKEKNEEIIMNEKSKLGDEADEKQIWKKKKQANESQKKWE